MLLLVYNQTKFGMHLLYKCKRHMLQDIQIVSASI